MQGKRCKFWFEESEIPCRSTPESGASLCFRHLVQEIKQHVEEGRSEGEGEGEGKVEVEEMETEQEEQTELEEPQKGPKEKPKGKPKPKPKPKPKRVPRKLKKTSLKKSWEKEYIMADESKIIDMYERSSPDVRMFATMFNGGYPYLVAWNQVSGEIRVFEETRTETETAVQYNYSSTPILCLKRSEYERAFWGHNMTKEGWDTTGCSGVGFRYGEGNSVLIHITGPAYLFVGDKIALLNFPERIVSYYSRVGNNDVTYPVAVGLVSIYELSIRSVFRKSELKLGTLVDQYMLTLWGRVYHPGSYIIRGQSKVEEEEEANLKSVARKSLATTQDEKREAEVLKRLEVFKEPRGKDRRKVGKVGKPQDQEDADGFGKIRKFIADANELKKKAARSPPIVLSLFPYGPSVNGDWLTYYTAQGQGGEVQLPFCVRLSLEQKKLVVFPRHKYRGGLYDYDTFRPVMQLDNFHEIWFGSDFDTGPFDGREEKRASMIAYRKFLKELQEKGDAYFKTKPKVQTKDKDAKRKFKLDLPYQTGEGLSFLVQTKPNEYVYIGDRVFTFRTNSKLSPERASANPIDSFHCVAQYGKSGMEFAASFALSRDNIYFLSAGVRCSKEGFPSDNPYLHLQDLLNAKATQGKTSIKGESKPERKLVDVRALDVIGKVVIPRKPESC